LIWFTLKSDNSNNDGEDGLLPSLVTLTKTCWNSDLSTMSSGRSAGTGQETKVFEQMMKEMDEMDAEMEREIQENNDDSDSENEGGGTE
jgi:hypothetical protein